MPTLAFRGVPLTVAPLITRADAASPAFAAAQRAFENRRGGGTPLLSQATAAPDPGPAAYVRAVLTDMLARHAAGENPRPTGDDELAAAAEAHLALIEALAAVAAVEPASPASVAPAPPSPVRFAAVEGRRPPWLIDPYLRSLLRVEGQVAPRTTAPPTSTSSPLIRLADESAHWRGIPPHGAAEKVLAERRAAAMAAVAAATPMYVPPLPRPPPPAGGGEPSPEWLGVATARFGGAVSSGMGAAVPVPSGDAVRSATLRKLAESRAQTPVSSERARVIDAGTVLDFLLNFDVMREYDHQPV